MSDAKIEIICTACGIDSFLLRKPQYEGFKKIGEMFACAACGHEYQNEAEIPYKKRKTLTIFSDADQPQSVTVFEESEKGRICCYCKNYLVNPFKQWCAHHKKEVEATDTCDQFTLKPETPKPETK